jgi:hypothetical protein
MSNAAFITTIIAVSAFMLAAVLGVAYFVTTQLGSRIDDLGGRMDHFDGRFGHLEEVVQGLREDVAVLKATQ